MYTACKAPVTLTVDAKPCSTFIESFGVVVVFEFENKFITPVILEPEVFSAKSKVTKLLRLLGILLFYETITPLAAMPPLKLTLNAPKLFCTGIVTIPPLSGKA